jgi:hypothetical protein
MDFMRKLQSILAPNLKPVIHSYPSAPKAATKDGAFAHTLERAVASDSSIAPFGVKGGQQLQERPLIDPGGSRNRPAVSVDPPGPTIMPDNPGVTTDDSIETDADPVELRDTLESLTIIERGRRDRSDAVVVPGVTDPTLGANPVPNETATVRKAVAFATGPVPRRGVVTQDHRNYVTLISTGGLRVMPGPDQAFLAAVKEGFFAFTPEDRASFQAYWNDPQSLLPLAAAGDPAAAGLKDWLGAAFLVYQEQANSRSPLGGFVPMQAKPPAGAEVGQVIAAAIRAKLPTVMASAASTAALR